MICERCGTNDDIDPVDIGRVEMYQINFVAILCTHCERMLCRHMMHSSAYREFKDESAMQDLLFNLSCGGKLDPQQITKLYKESRRASYENLLKLYDVLCEFLQRSKEEFNKKD